ncbi:gamma-glutamyltransferase family protein [Mesorhizobium sp. BR1-1-16]|uniref:gamma-glutamyltransferase family protein n=1 Tax=Mesorhizobium sp. BR1-1-16 TaxID=2876653 RepID=UPI001CCD1BD1|nr:gamma-glutamyltransferase family protein [Mesorhizobium sp. BR1-1-16]MBZ9938131.1 gamma-glutamyltransferase family protein [Mesorhizobium sp. BR1-1-16]
MAANSPRQQIVGTFGVVASSHWIASAVGMSMLEKGGNAFDAAVATGLVLQVLEPHLNGPGGDMPAVFYSKKTDKVEVICGQGPAPAAASIAHYRAEGLDRIPGNGLLATVIPGSFGGWMLMLRDYGRLSLRDVLSPALRYAENGHPMLPRVATTIADLGEFFREEWPTSFDTWLPGGKAPAPWSKFTNPALARTWRRLLDEAESRRGREAQIEGAREAFYSGFVAEAVDRFVRDTALMDESGQRHKGVLTGADMAAWRATIEAPAIGRYHDWMIAKTGPWGQGPVFLEALAILEEFDLAAMDPNGPDFVHTVIEAEKLAFADREVYYGDPAAIDVPLAHLLSSDYARERARLISGRASAELRPGVIPGYEDLVARTMAMLAPMSGGAVYEPTMEHLTERRGDTVHLDVIDEEGNMVSVTPSGGWLQSSPVIPELGFCLNSRAQMFWLTEGLASSLAPGRRPRTTLTPSLALKNGVPAMIFGTPGGDQQEQWQLPMFLRHVHHGLNLQDAIEAPAFHTAHFPASFYPRTSDPASLMIERDIGEATLAELRARGHRLTVADPQTVGRLTAAERDASGVLRAGATTRLQQAYAIGR